MITQEKLQEQCERYKIDDKWVISRLYEEARNDKNKGFERLEAIKILARIMGVEIGSPMSLIQIVNHYLLILMSYLYKTKDVNR